MAEHPAPVASTVEDERAVLRAWGATIRRYRQWQRLSRRELACRAGMSPVYLGEIERGEKDASVHTLTLICAALGIRLGELYLRVATALDTAGPLGTETQPALPLMLREPAGAFTAGVPLAQDETAFELYQAARSLRSDQQISLLMLARSLASPRE
jgi:transcriptional regulator with XRE-family HTH domain